MTFFAIGVLCFLAGWLIGSMWGTVTSNKSDRVTIPLYVGRGDEGKLVSSVELPDEEARLLIAAVKSFVVDMEQKYGPVYLPTATEMALADIAAEGNQSEDGAELGDLDWAEIQSQA